MATDNFTQTYLNSIGSTKVIEEAKKASDTDKKEEKEEKKDKICPDCGKEPCECECDDTDNSPAANSDIITAGDDDKELDTPTDDDDLDLGLDDKDDESEDKLDDLDSEDKTEDKKLDEEESDDATCFCFKTINKDLIDAINSGFDKVTFTVKAKDDEGNETTTDVEFSADAFEDFGECDCDDLDSDSDEDLDDLDDLDLDDEDEEFGDVEDSADEEDNELSNSFESVFKRYYGSLIGESKRHIKK